MKGYVNIVEAIIGAMIILGVMMFVFAPQPIQKQSVYEITYQCLEYAKDFSDVESHFAQCIPSTYDYDYRLCGTASCSVSLPENKTIVSAEYIHRDGLMKVWVYK